MLLRDVGPAQVQTGWLPADDTTQHGGGDGFSTAQVNVRPEPLVTAPGWWEEWREVEDRQKGRRVVQAGKYGKKLLCM